MAEGRSWEDRTVPFKELPPLCSCGAPLRPDVVFYNEALDRNVLDSAFSEAAGAEIMLVVGTSCPVYPAAYLPILGKQNGAVLIEINLEPTPISSLSDAMIVGESGRILPKLVDKLRAKFE
jgi:NAD-dependent deacetylase